MTKNRETHGKTVRVGRSVISSYLDRKSLVSNTYIVGGFFGETILLYIERSRENSFDN